MFACFVRILHLIIVNKQDGASKRYSNTSLLCCLTHDNDDDPVENIIF